MPKDKNNGREMTPDEKFRSFFSTTAVDIPEEMTRRDENQPEEKLQKRFGLFGRGKEKQETDEAAAEQPQEMPTGEVRLGEDAQPEPEADLELMLKPEADPEQELAPWPFLEKEAEDAQQTETADGTEDAQLEETADNAEGSQDSENQDVDRTEDVQQNAGNEQEDESQNTKGQPEETTEGTDDSQMKIYTEDQLQVDENGNVQTDGSEKDQKTYEATATVEDSEDQICDFGTVKSDFEDVEAQYVQITNTGNESLNFQEISPEHFMVQDISDPMEQNSSQQLWIVPRAGIAAGEYDDTITYTSEEGVEVSFEAKMTVEAAKDDAQNGNGQDDQKTDTGNTSDPTADDQNKGDETPADSTTDPSNDANTSDGGNNGSTTTEVTAGPSVFSGCWLRCVFSAHWCFPTPPSMRSALPLPWTKPSAPSQDRSRCG